jgi:hypothetical protein
LKHLAVVRMFIFPARLGLAFALALFCMGGKTAHGQAAPLPYWIPSWPFGFGGNLTAGQNWNTYGNFLGFDSADARGRYNFLPNGWFAVPESGAMGLSMNGISQDLAFDNLHSFSYQGVQFGYNFKSAGGLPFTVYAGFDTLKYDNGIAGPLAPFDTTQSGYSAHTGIEFQPAPNVSLSLGLGYTQQPGRW